MNALPAKIVRRILECCRRGRAAVIVAAGGKPGRVYGLESYRKMMDVPPRHQPWRARRRAAGAPDPLGAVNGRVLGALGRDRIYEE